MTRVSNQPTHATHAKKFKFNVCQHMTHHEKLNSRNSSSFHFVYHQLLRAWLIRPVVSFVRFIRPFPSFVRPGASPYCRHLQHVGRILLQFPWSFSVPFGRCHLLPINQDIFGGLLDVLRSGLALFPGLGTNFVEFFQLKYDRELKHVFLVQNAKPEVAFI